MKRLIIFFMVMLAGMHAYAQLPTVTTTPGEIDALTENVTIEFDVTGTTVEGVADIYIWAWCPQIPAPTEILLDYEQGSASWGSISENAKLATVEGQPNKRRLQLPITVTRAGVEQTFRNVAELFGNGETPGKIKEFGFLLRSQDGSKQTPGDLATKVTLVPLEFSEAFVRIFPAKVSNMDMVTVYMNLNKLTEATENPKLMVAGAYKAVVVLKDAEGASLLEASDLEMTPERAGEYGVTFSPLYLGEFAEGTSIEDAVGFDIKFVGELISGASTVDVESKVYEVTFQIYE